MKYIGIDYGTTRIGLAVSDDTGTLAFPLTTLQAGPGALAQVAELVRKNAAEKIVIGESRNYKNEPNAVMEDIEQFKKNLAELVGLRVEYEPEFMTTAQAAREGETSPDKLDAAAAALILQSYLDRNRKVQ